MSAASRLLLSLLVASVWLPFGCHGGGGSAPIKSSLQTPQPGSSIGNWVVAQIQPNPDVATPIKGRMKIVESMNFRIAPAGVDVLADEYIGPGTKLPEIMSRFYGGDYELKQFPLPNESGFSVDLLLDYSPLFNVAPRTLYTQITARLELVGAKLVVKIRLDDFWPAPGGGSVRLEWNDLVVTCDPGAPIPSLVGELPVTKVLALADPNPNKPLPFPVPLARRPKPGDKIVVGPEGQLTMFGTQFDSKGFIEQFPSFDLFHHLLLIDNGVIQGLVSAIGASKLSFVCDFNLFHTGGLLQGDIRMVWPEAGVYHAYIVADPNPQFSAASGDPSIQVLDPLGSTRLLRYPEDLRAAAKRLQVVLPQSRR